MSKFQIILLGVFALFIVIGVAVFSLYRGSSANKPTVTIWGDIPSRELGLLLTSQTLNAQRQVNLVYVEKDSETLSEEYTEALALGQGPDLVMISQDMYWKDRQKFVPIPFSSLGERDFIETFVEEAELFLGEEGIYALPFSVDPMVLYYNRDLLSTAGRANPIEYWDEIYESAPDLSKRDAAGNLITSTIALGESRNIANFKEIVSLLMLQAGTPITAYSGDQLRSVVNIKFDQPVVPAESALNFYTQFSNPTRIYYSWNRSLTDAQTHFTSGDSAYYLGFASELKVIRNKNPNLNIGVAPVPQSRVDENKKITYGRVYGLAISRGTRNTSAAFQAALLLVSQGAAKTLAEMLALPPARRDLLNEKQGNATLSVFYEAALQSRGWLDPDPAVTKTIFSDAVESITSGRARTSEALSKVHRDLDALIR